MNQLNLVKKLKKIKVKIDLLLGWIPIILNDEQYDYHYLLKILEHKLKLMENYYDSDEVWTVDGKVVASEIRKSKEAIQRLMENDYVDMGKMELVETGVSESGHVQITIESEKSDDEIIALTEKEGQLIQQDLHNAFDTIRDNVKGWWD